jgi:hypothetical protein
MHNTTKLKLHLLTADKLLRPYLPQIQKLAQPVLKTVQKLLPFKESVDIVVYRYHAASPDFATSGYTPTGNTLWLYTDPAQKGYKKLLPEQLPKVLAHELHHACRWQGPGYGKTLKEAIITEGLAAHFEEEVVGGTPSSFYIQFTEKVLARLFKKAQSEIDSKFYNYNNWFFGNKAKNIPPHAGYGLGYWLTKEALKSKKPSELVLAKAGQILK